jgi:hypothetical protein
VEQERGGDGRGQCGGEGDDSAGGPLQDAGAGAGGCAAEHGGYRGEPMLIYNPRHLLAVLSEFVAHYNEHRPHQSRDQRPPDVTNTRPAVVDLASARIRRRKILDGLINEYSQAA